MHCKRTTRIPDTEIRMPESQRKFYLYRNDEQEAVTTMREGRISVYETRRYHEVMNRTIQQSGIWFYDPQGDEPLEGQVEDAMEQMGPGNYLRWLCKHYRVDVSPLPPTEHECRRAVRIAIRSLKEFPGERFIQ